MIAADISEKSQTTKRDNGKREPAKCSRKGGRVDPSALRCAPSSARSASRSPASPSSAGRHLECPVDRDGLVVQHLSVERLDGRLSLLHSLQQQPKRATERTATGRMSANNRELHNEHSEGCGPMKQGPSD